MSLYEASVPQFIKVLRNLEKWLDKASEQAAAKKFEPEVLLAARLAPDQYPLLRQIQSACDAAKAGAARLAGQTPPSHPDTEQTLSEIRARIHTCVAFLESLPSRDFEAAEARVITLPFLGGKTILGSDYLHEIALPNFYFHATTAYAILRHNGVPLGKLDFLGGAKLRDA